MASSNPGTPALPASAITAARTTSPTSAARRHWWDSHGLPTVVTAAAAARKASDGNRVDATQVPVRIAPGTRPGRSIPASTSVSRAAPTTAARTTSPRRRKRRWIASTTTTATGTATAPTCASASASARMAGARRSAARPRSVVTPAVDAVATEMSRASAAATTPHNTSRSTSPGWR